MSQSTEKSFSLTSSQTSTDSGYRLSTQELLTVSEVRSQEASSASDFILNLTSSQISISGDNTIIATVSPAVVNDDSNYHNTNSVDDIYDDDDDDDNTTNSHVNTDEGYNGDDCTLVMVEKRKRGRKPKNRTAEELEKHLRDKKEKNRLAARRLRQRKCTESQKYDKEVKEYERKIEVRKKFAKHLEGCVEQLRNRIKGLTRQHNDNNNNNDNNNIVNNNNNIMTTTTTTTTTTINTFNNNNNTNNIINISNNNNNNIINHTTNTITINNKPHILYVIGGSGNSNQQQQQQLQLQPHQRVGTQLTNIKQSPVIIKLEKSMFKYTN